MVKKEQTSQIFEISKFGRYRPEIGRYVAAGSTQHPSPAKINFFVNGQKFMILSKKKTSPPPRS